MRSVVFGLLLVACGGNNGNGGDDDGTGDAGPDAPPPETPLDQRITVTSITTPAGVLGGDSSWRIWGIGDLHVAPTFTVPLADCGTLVGYTTGGGTPTARVARLDAGDALVATFDLGSFVLRGLAAEPDGHFAALLWDQVPTPHVLHVQRFDATGAPSSWNADLSDALAAPTDFGIGESRLEFGDGQYGAYFHVHGISGFANGHEGDQLKWVDAGSGAVTNGWSWGCSHSMSELLRFDAPSTKFLVACVTDCFPGTSGGNFGTDSIGGVYLDNSRKVTDVDGGCNGSVAGELGGAAPSGAGWKLVFNAHQNPAVMGQSSYNPSTMNQDVGFASIASDMTPSAVVWLTTTTGNEANATIARWRPAGDDTEQYVIGWADGSTHKLAPISPAGAFVVPPIDVTVAWGERDDPFREHVNGDVVWTSFASAGASSFSFARLHTGRTAQCASF